VPARRGVNRRSEKTPNTGGRKRGQILKIRRGMRFGGRRWRLFGMFRNKK